MILFISGCSATPRVEYNTVYVPQKCVIPKVQEPQIDNWHYETNADIIAKALSNYTHMKEYAEKLLKAQEVCE
jgi:hypothetical protein